MDKRSNRNFPYKKLGCYHKMINKMINRKVEQKEKIGCYRKMINKKVEMINRNEQKR